MLRSHPEGYTPILSNRNDSLSTYLVNLLKNTADLKKSACKSSVIFMAKTIAVIIGSSSGIPYISVAMQLLPEYLFLGILLAYGVFTSLAILVTWALLDLVHAVFSQTDEEKMITGIDKSWINRIIYWIFIFTASFLAAFPVSYLTYQYNDNSFFFAGVTLFTDFITNSCSLNYFIVNLQYMFALYFGKQEKKYLEQLRVLLIEQLEKSAALLPSNMSSTEIQTLQTSIDEFELTESNAPDARHFLYLLLHLSKNQLIIEEKHKRWFQGFAKIGIIFFSIIFPCSAIPFGVLNSYKSLNLIYSNELFRWSVSVLSTTPYILLEIRLAKTVFSQFYVFIIEKMFKTHNKSIAQIFYSKTNIGLTILGLLTTSLAFGSRAKFVLDMIPGDIGIFLAVMVCISAVTYKSAAMLKLIQYLFQQIAARYGTTPVKKTATLQAAINRFTLLLREARSDKIQDLVENLEEKELMEVLPPTSAFIKFFKEYKEHAAILTTNNDSHDESLPMKNNSDTDTGTADPQYPPPIHVHRV